MAEKSLGKSCRFRTSGSTFWSRSTRSRFGFIEHTKIIGIPLVLLTSWSISFLWAQEIIEIPMVLLTLWSISFPWAQEIIWNSWGFDDMLIHQLSMGSINHVNSVGFDWHFTFWVLWTLDAGRGTTRGKLFSKIGLAIERFRAIDLACRACGAGAWALGLDSRLGHSRFAPVFTPNLRPMNEFEDQK